MEASISSVIKGHEELREKVGCLGFGEGAKEKRKAVEKRERKLVGFAILWPWFLVNREEETWVFFSLGVYLTILEVKREKKMRREGIRRQRIVCLVRGEDTRVFLCISFGFFLFSFFYLICFGLDNSK